MEKRDRATHDSFGPSGRLRRLRLRREEAVFIERHKSREWRRNEKRTAPAQRGRLAGKAACTQLGHRIRIG